MRQASFALLAAMVLVPQAAPALPLRNTLGDDQRSERITVSLDGKQVGVLAVDAAHREASLELELAAPTHRYRLEGESVLADGSRLKILGAGLIVSSERMDALAEKSATGAAAFASYLALVEEIRAAAPEGELDDLVPGAARKATDEEIAAAEKRLAVTLPEGYRHFVRTVGSFRIGGANYTAAEVFAPGRLMTARDLVVADTRDNGWTDGLDELSQRIAKRYPRATRDVVLDRFELDAPTVLWRGMKCPQGQAGIALPGSDFDLLLVDPGDNPFLALLDYEDDIMGEAQCMDYHRLLAYSLHDHLLEMGDEVFVLHTAETVALTLRRGDVDEQGKRVWMELQRVKSDSED